MPTRTIHAALSDALADCVKQIQAAQTFCITSHVNSDGDSIGSTVGLYHLLRSLGKTARIINPTPLPYNFRFLHGSEAVETFDAGKHASFLASADVLFVLDANAPSRMRGMEEAITNSKATTIVIDHHQDPAPFADLYIVDTEACSTAELMYNLAGQLHLPSLSKAFAEAVYTGIMTDTGNFRFPRTDAGVHRIIAELLECGVEPFHVYDHVFNQNPFARSLLLGNALTGLELHVSNRLCIMTITQAMMRSTNTNEDHIEGVVEHALAIAGVQMGALIVELPTEFKISLRSKGAIPVNRIAGHFGGGGHTNAAGCRTTLSLPEFKQILIELATPHLTSSTAPRNA
jgi:bifunctional oligoribonuclease and PAP phosphatase NrnA